MLPELGEVPIRLDLRALGLQLLGGEIEVAVGTRFRKGQKTRVSWGSASAACPYFLRRD